MSVLERIKDIISLPLKLWVLLVALPCIIIFAMVASQSVIPGLIILGITLYPMYRVLKSNEDAQTQAGDSKVFLSEEQMKATVDYLLEVKKKKDRTTGATE